MDPDRPAAVDQRLRDAIRAIPKTESHLHIEGALPYELLHELDPIRFPENPPFRERSFRFENFVSFETLLIDHAVAWYNSAERYHEASKRIFERLAAQNVVYVETSLHLAMIEFIRVEGPELISAIKSAAPDGMNVKVIGGLCRDGYTEVMAPVIDSLHEWKDLDGIDMHGQEWLKLEDWAAPVWRRFREAGKIIKAHAGEFGGPEKIREALDVLGATRIQHGVRAIEDPKLVARLADEGIVLDMCPISNEKLGVVPSLESHPIRSLRDEGVVCTVNTDDPLCFANTLTDEYEALAAPIGFSQSEIAEIAKNGFRCARMDGDLKRSCIEQIDLMLAD